MMRRYEITKTPPIAQRERIQESIQHQTPGKQPSLEEVLVEPPRMRLGLDRTSELENLPETVPIRRVDAEFLFQEYVSRKFENEASEIKTEAAESVKFMWRISLIVVVGYSMSVVSIIPRIIENPLFSLAFLPLIVPTALWYSLFYRAKVQRE